MCNSNAFRFSNRIRSRSCKYINIQIIIENAKIPVVIDAGIGSPSEAAFAMEIGADAVLVNTAIASPNTQTNGKCHGFRGYMLVDFLIYQDEYFLKNLQLQVHLHKEVNFLYLKQ